MRACVILYLLLAAGCAARSVRAEIDIAAPPEVVWGVLTDFPRYREWNSFTTQVDGALAAGGDLLLHVQLQPGRAQKLQKQHLTIIEPARALGWETQFLSRREPRAVRLQQLTPLPDGGTHYATVATFTGSFVPLVMSLYRQDLERGFAAMTVALKARAELRARAGALAPALRGEPGRIAE